MSVPHSPLDWVRRRWSRLSLALGTVAIALAASVTACGDDDPTSPGQNPTVAIALDRSSVTLKTGEQTTLVATALDENGQPTGATISWSAENPEVATINAAGVLTAVSFGNASVTASAEGVDVSADVTVQPLGTVIGPAGGIVISADANAMIDIPAGAVATPTDVELRVAQDAVFGGDPAFVPGTGYELRPATLRLQLQTHAHLSIRVRMGNLPPGVTADQLRVRERDCTDNHWHAMEHMGLMNGFVVADLQQAGFYGLVIQSAPIGIGPEGGTVTSTDGNAVLVIPAGALTAPTEISIVPAADADFGTDPGFVPGSGYEVRPAGLQLQIRAQLRIRFDPAHLPQGATPEQLRIRERDRLQNQWRDCIHGGLQNQFVAAEIQRSGFYGLMARPIVGTAGGVVTSADGNAVLTIPAGALASDIEVTIEPAEDPAMLADPLYVRGTAYEIRPLGTPVNAPMQLRIHYDPANMPAGSEPDRLRIRERDRTQNQWRDCDHQGSQGQMVTSTVNAFGTFAVVATAPQHGAVSRVTVSPAVVSIDEGQTIQMSAVVMDEDGHALDVPVTWASDNTAIATVSPTGLVTGVSEGTVSITATADGVKGGGNVNVKRKVQPASINVTPATASISAGGTVQLNAEVRDAGGNIIAASVTWKSSANGVATVSSAGLVTGVAVGTATITASVQNLSAQATVTVNPPVTQIVIDAGGNEPLEVGLTKQLVATAYNAQGQPVTVTFTWTSSNTAIATVDATGLVKGVGRGTATITARVGTVSASVDIKVVGESTVLGNNMSWPTVFADGIGLTGLAVATDPGVRPGPTEGITVDVLPFFYSGNVADYGTYYLQQGLNTWRAALIDGTGQSAYDAEAYWGDNITAKEWSASKPIRIEVALSATGVGTLKGYNMTYLFGEGPTEMQGTDGTTGDFIPLIYALGNTFKVERLSGEGGSVVAKVQEGPIGSEVNVGGRIVYGEQLKLSTWSPPAGMTIDGWYRLTFTITSPKVMLRSVGNTSGMFLPVVVNTKVTSIDVHITP